MGNRVKTILMNLLEENTKRKLRGVKSFVYDFSVLIVNTYRDFYLYYKHSMVFKENTFNKVESRIILHYHSLEKGFLHENFRFRFGEYRINELAKLLKHPEVVDNYRKSQIAAAYLAVCKYYEIHESHNVDISDYFSNDDYQYFKKLSTLTFDIIKTHTPTSFFKSSESSFLSFSKSRMSTRNFTGEKVPFETIKNVIELAKTAPSVCNRQSTKIYYVEDKKKISTILNIQKGLKGYSDDISQLLVIVSDRNYFYSVGERNQLYIDGGIFLMNLLYALHYYKIGACPAHWGLTSWEDKKIQKELNLSNSEKVVSLLPIGILKKEFRTTLSLRRENDEILKVVRINS